MKLLILGGTAFAGRHITEAAIKQGHQVTLFNRSKTNVNLFPEALRLIGDRDGGLEALLNKTWDAVIDVNGYLPRLVGDSARFLQDSVNHYIYISTLAVYDLDVPQKEIDEQSPLVSTVGIETEDFMGPAYGALKLLCEQEVSKRFPDRSTILRLGYIAGPYDPTDRITYWVDRIARGGNVLVPQSPEDPFQFIDARDIADSVLKVAENKVYGTFNLTGEVQTWQSWLSDCQSVADSNVTLTWINDAEFINQHLGDNYRPFGAFPLMNIKEVFKCNNHKAVMAGLHCRSPIDTARDLLAWHSTRTMSAKECPELDILALENLDLSGGEDYWIAGINAKHEKNMLSKWLTKNES